MFVLHHQVHVVVYLEVARFIYVVVFDIVFVVSGLRTECAECQIRSVSRSNELKQLLIASLKYGDKMAQVDTWLSELEARIDASKREAIGDAVEVVDKQIQQHLVSVYTCFGHAPEFPY